MHAEDGLNSSHALSLYRSVHFRDHPDHEEPGHAGAIGLTWFATRHPYLAAAIAAALLAAVVLLIRAAWRTMARWIDGARDQWRRWRPAS